MNSSPIDRFMRHPRRRWIITAATFVVGLIFLLPAVDSFTAACSQRQELLAQLEADRSELARLPEWERRLRERSKQLRELKLRCLTDETTEAFQSELVELEHREHCNLRRIHIDQPRLRDWLGDEDHPLQDRPPEGTEGETPYYLKSRSLMLSVEGPLTRIHELLREIQSTDQFVHSSLVSIRPAEGNSGTVTLDLELLLFDLVRKQGQEG